MFFFKKKKTEEPVRDQTGTRSDSRVEMMPSGKRKEISVFAYINGNLGDDLFVKTLCGRYPDCDFVLMSGDDDYVRRMGISNLRHGSCSAEKDLRDFAAVSIGGSVFMEKDGSSIEELDRRIEASSLFGRFFILSPNFGPYRTEEYLRKCRDWFGTVDDICFRDRRSYDMFSDINTVRCAPDAAFCMERPAGTVKEKRVLLSCMQEFDGSSSYADPGLFIDKLAETAEYYLEKGYEVTALSFCGPQGDLEAARKISERCGGRVGIADYNVSNLDEIVDLIAKSEYVIAARYHSAVISFCVGTKVLPLIYNIKTENTLNDMGFPYMSASVKDFCAMTMQEIDENRQKPAFDISGYAAKAQGQFAELDRLLLGEGRGTGCGTAEEESELSGQGQEGRGTGCEDSRDEAKLSIQVQSVVYKNSKRELYRSVESTANAARVYFEKTGVKPEIIYTSGDASGEPVLTEEDAAKINEKFGSWLTYRYRRFSYNTGYGKGHDILSQGTRSEFLCIMNPDIIVSPTFFIHMLEPFREKSVGITEARQTPVEHNKYYDPETGKTGWASGSCFMIRSSLFLKLWGFDCSTFFMYMEDVDLSWRVRLLGYDIIYRPQAPAFHAKRVSKEGEGQPSDTEWYYSVLGHLLLSVKWSNKERADRLIYRFFETGHDPQMRAVLKYQEAEKNGRFPEQLDPEHKVAEFVGDLSYTRNRFT